MSDKKEIVSASPKVRKLAREFGANIYQIEGSQRAGRVSEEDVKSYIKNVVSEKTTKKLTIFKNIMDDLLNNVVIVLNVNTVIC